MVVCICNRLTDTMISEAVSRGARSPTDVFRHFRMRRGCSSCTVRVAEAIDRARHQADRQAAE